MSEDKGQSMGAAVTKLEIDGIFDIVEHRGDNNTYSDIQTRSMRGWRLVGVFHRSNLEMVSIYDDSSRCNVQRRELVTRTYLIVRKDEGSLLSEEVERSRGLESDVRKLEERIRQLDEQRAGAEREKDAAQASVRRLEGEVRMGNEARRKMCESSQRLEEDMGKIRRAVGEVELKRILG